MIEGDSGEYEFLTEAVQLAANVSGLCAEIGVRRGMGTKHIIDAVSECALGKTVIGIDPFGSIPYVGREHIGEIRLDYDNNMRHDCLIDLVNYAYAKGINWLPFIMTDVQFFATQSGGVEINYITTWIECKYAMVHLDGPHNYEHVSMEIMWFNERMDSGATIVVDDITTDFIDIVPINELFISLGWEILKQGAKKGLYRKI